MLEADHPGRRALGHITRILGQRPTKDDHELSALTLCLAEFREAMIARSRNQAPTHRSRECLMHLNAVISVAMGMHFPLGQPPWDEFEKCEAWLTTLVESVERLDVAS